VSATALPAHDSLLPRPPGGNGPGAALALLAHAGLILALTTVVDWRTRDPEAVSAELWAAVPQVAAPPPAPAVTPQRQHRPRAEHLPRSRHRPEGRASARPNKTDCVPKKPPRRKRPRPPNASAWPSRRPTTRRSSSKRASARKPSARSPSAGRPPMPRRRNTSVQRRTPRPKRSGRYNSAKPTCAA
jgi:colicin import membrane protein